MRKFIPARGATAAHERRARRNQPVTLHVGQRWLQNGGGREHPAGVGTAVSRDWLSALRPANSSAPLQLLLARVRLELRKRGERAVDVLGDLLGNLGGRGGQAAVDVRARKPAGTRVWALGSKGVATHLLFSLLAPVTSGQTIRRSSGGTPPSSASSTRRCRWYAVRTAKGSSTSLRHFSALHAAVRMHRRSTTIEHACTIERVAASGSPNSGDFFVGRALGLRTRQVSNRQGEGWPRAAGSADARVRWIALHGTLSESKNGARTDRVHDCR